MNPRSAKLVPVLVALAFGAACGGNGDEEPSGLPRKSIPAPSDQPYVSVAVDNHFHDVHIEDDITIGFGQGFIVKNQGNNLHNVTIPEIDFDQDIETGAQVEFLDEELAPGTYNIICKYHSSEGMVGKITVSSVENG